MRKGYTAALAVVGVAAAVALFSISDYAPSSMSLHSVDHDYTKFLSKFGKSYGTKEEFNHRKQIFQKNNEFVNKHNSKNGVSYTLKVNKFSDWTHTEYKKLLGFKKGEHAGKHIKNLTTDQNGPVDWRKYLPAVKDQGQCGSCWAFSTVASLEAHHALKKGSILSLSEQQLVDCSTSYGNQGCNGGMYEAAFQYVRDNGITTEGEYPYVGYDQSCSYQKDGKVKVNSYAEVSADANQMKAALMKGPVSVAVEADTQVFQSYSGGILDDSSCGTNLDHAITAVGWGSTGGKDYWLVRNSWGSWWGESGYIRIAANPSSGDCGILNGPPSYPDTD
jgi:C1A family cysteine protease